MPCDRKSIEVPAAAIALLAFVHAAPADGGVLAELLAGGHRRDIERRLEQLESLGCVARDEGGVWWCTERGSLILSSQRVVCWIEEDVSRRTCQ